METVPSLDTEIEQPSAMFASQIDVNGESEIDSQVLATQAYEHFEKRLLMRSLLSNFVVCSKHLSKQWI